MNKTKDKIAFKVCGTYKKELFPLACYSPWGSTIYISHSMDRIAYPVFSEIEDT
jgi:hypothetical protein